MANPRQAILDAIGPRGLSLASASRMIGRSDRFLHRFVHEDVPRQLRDPDRRHLALCLDLPEDDLIVPDARFGRGA
ncbi:MAG TPA: hypothetical protein VF695_16045 [Sphingomonas sp.]|jgi:hypothetical protein